MGSPDASRGFTAQRNQAICSFGLLAVLVGTCLVTDQLARNRGLELSLMAKSRDFADKTGTLFSQTGNFIDFEERVLLDELPRADYSRGGVYFFGTSNMKWAFQTWDFPAELKRLIGNYGIGASSHTTQLRLIRFLAEQRGFLKAGERDLVILGVSFHLARKEPSTGFFASLLHRHGLYTMTSDNRIAPVPMSAIERWLRIEKARSGGFLWNFGRLAKGWAATLGGWHRTPPHDGAKYRQAWREFMGPDWQHNMDAEVERLRQTIALLGAHHAKVKVMLLPQGTWMDALPFKARYESQVRTVCQETATPLIDLSRALPDEDFVDSNHLTVKGQEAFRGLIMGGIMEHLQNVEKVYLPPVQR